MATAAAKRQEERVKLFAAALSNLGVATVVTGVVGPALTGRARLLTGVVAAVLGLLLHLAAQGVLHRVVNDSPDRDE